MAKFKLTSIDKKAPVIISAKEVAYVKKNKNKRNYLIFSIIINVISITYILTNL